MSAAAELVLAPLAGWVDVCALEDIWPDMGVCARVGGEQVAVFRVGGRLAGEAGGHEAGAAMAAQGELHAIGNYDPNSGANVLARGIVGELKGRRVVASPIYKQHFDLRTGECLEDPAASVRVRAVRVVAGRVQVEADAPAADGRQERRSLVVIGAGLAALRVIEELLRVAPELYRITLFGAEPRGSYDRVLLSPLLAGDARSDEIVLATPEWYARRGIVLHAGDPVTRIDRARRTVRAASGYEIRYDRLLIATGSRPVMLQVPGSTLPGVVTFRDLQDVERMLDAARPGGRAVVIGGGLLGLEAAHGLVQRGMSVTVVHRSATLMNRQLDATAATLLRADLEARGFAFATGVEPCAIAGTGHAAAVLLDDGRELPADLVVMAAGTRPDVTLARSAGLRCDRGIVVDDTLQTFDPCIYAVGECVQHRDATYGFVAPLREQAGVCATHLARAGFGRYVGSTFATQLKVPGITLWAAGRFGAAADEDDLLLRDAAGGIYKRLVLRGGRIVGIVLYGDAQDGPWYLDLMRRRIDVGACRARLLFGPRRCPEIAVPAVAGRA